MAGRKEDVFKLYNLRYVPLFALVFVLGILCVSFSDIVAAIVLVVALLCLFALFITKSIGRNIAVLLAVVLLLGFGLASGALYWRNQTGAEGYVTATCRAVSVSQTSDGYRVVGDSLCCDGTRYTGGITLTTDNPVAVGDHVTAYGTIEIDKLSLETMYDALKYRTGTKYVMNASACETTAGAAPLATRIRDKIRECLVAFEGERSGGFSYAMFFGDTDYMFGSDKATLRAVGGAHIFAVSGLHVGVLSAAMIWLLKKLKANRLVILLTMLPILGFYAYLASFTPSVLRASMMVLLYLLASTLGMRYDDLSALSFSAFVILLVKPLWLFDLSFIMSFLSLLGIISLASPLEKVFSKCKIPPKLSSALALSVSTSIALFPLSATVFGTASLLGVLVNIVIVPLASVTYILTVLLLPFALLYSGFGAVIQRVGYLPLGIIEIAEWANKANVTGEHDFYAWEFILYYGTLALVGKHSLARKKVKLAVGGIAAATFAIVIFAV